MTERTDLQVVEELDEPDELPWDEVDLEGAGAFVEGEGVELCSVAAAEVVDAFAEAGVCSSGVGVLFVDGEANESRPGPSALSGVF